MGELMRQLRAAVIGCLVSIYCWDGSQTMVDSIASLLLPLLALLLLLLALPATAVLRSRVDTAQFLVLAASALRRLTAVEERLHFLLLPSPSSLHHKYKGRWLLVLIILRSGSGRREAL